MELSELGLILSQNGKAARIRKLEERAAFLKSRIDELSAQGIRRNRETALIYPRLQEIDNMLQILRLDDSAFTGGIPEGFFSRFWNKNKIRANRPTFEAKLSQWYRENPFVYEIDLENGRWAKTRLSTHPQAIAERVKSTIDNILGEADQLGLENMSFGSGRSKHFRSRDLDIPNFLVADFIETNPLAVMKAYSARVAPRSEFTRHFGMELEDVRLDIHLDMARAGISEEEINKALLNFNALYDRIAGVTIRNPDANSRKFSNFLRDMASFTYMGGAFLANLPDAAKIVADSELRSVMAAVQSQFDSTSRKLTKKERMLNASVLEGIRGSAYMRFQEEITNGLFNSGIIDKARNAFYVINGLTPLTVFLKSIANDVAGHQILSLSRKWADEGTLPERDRIFLLGHGINEADARFYARMPIEILDTGLYVPR